MDAVRFSNINQNYISTSVLFNSNERKEVRARERERWHVIPFPVNYSPVIFDLGFFAKKRFLYREISHKGNTRCRPAQPFLYTQSSLSLSPKSVCRKISIRFLNNNNNNIRRYFLPEKNEVSFFANSVRRYLIFLVPFVFPKFRTRNQPTARQVYSKWYFQGIIGSASRIRVNIKTVHVYDIGPRFSLPFHTFSLSSTASSKTL